MPLPREVKIIKIPLSDKERIPDYPKSFPRMPRLYLELLENKAKIKQDLINKEYVPGSEPVQNEDDRHDKREDRQDRQDRPDQRNDRKDKRDDRRDDKRDKRDDNQDERRQSKSDGDTISVSERSSSHTDISNSDSDTDRSRKGKKYAEDTEIKDGHDDSHSDSRSDSREDSHSDSRSDSHSDSHSDSESNNDSDPLYDRLKDLLGDTSEKRENYSHSHSDKYSRSPAQSSPSQPSRASSHFTPYDKYKNIRTPEQTQPHAPAPTLAELEARGHYHNKAELRDINHVGAGEYEEEDRKRELIFKFDLLKKSYPLAGPTIPEYNIHSDLREMQKSYDTTVKKLSLDSTVENYKTYLIGGFMVVEFVFGNFLGFDMQGFTQQQIVSMHSYEKLLIELGEKSYVPEGSKWPVELRLLFLIVMNAGFFIVSKMIMRSTGANLLNMVNSMNTTSTAQTAAPRPKRRMQGPKINLDDIPDVDEQAEQVRK